MYIVEFLLGHFHSSNSFTQSGPTNDYIISLKNELQSHQATFE